MGPLKWAERRPSQPACPISWDLRGDFPGLCFLHCSAQRGQGAGVSPSQAQGSPGRCALQAACVRTGREGSVVRCGSCPPGRGCGGAQLAECALARVTGVPSAEKGAALTSWLWAPERKVHSLLRKGGSRRTCLPAGQRFPRWPSSLCFKGTHSMRMTNVGSAARLWDGNGREL